MSLLLAEHVAAGGLAVHAGVVNSGNVSLPTAPLGTLAPAQLPEFDQPGLPGGAPPLHVKSAVWARACEGSARAHAATIRATRSTSRLLRSLRQLRRESDRSAGRLARELRGARGALRLDRGRESLGHLFLPGLGEDRGLAVERDLALGHLHAPYAGAVREPGALATFGAKAEVAHVHIGVALVAVNHDRDVVVRRPRLRVLVVPARVRPEAVSHRDGGRYGESCG